MRGFPIFFVVSFGLHTLLLSLGGAEGRVIAIDSLQALSATIRLPVQQIQEPVIYPAQPNYSRLATRSVRQVAQSLAGKNVDQAAGEKAPISQPATTSAQEARPVDSVVLGFWEDDIDQRIKQAGQRFFTDQPGRARVAMVLSGSGELIELSVTGEAAGMAEKAIRSVLRWPRFEGEPRSFKRVLAFVVAA